MPQVYWSGAHNAGQQLQRSVYQFEHDLGWGMPTFPVGAAYPENGWTPTVQEITEFRNTVNTMGLPGYSWWEMYYATVTHPEFWDASVGKLDQEEQHGIEPVLMTAMPKFNNVNMRSGPGVQYSYVGKMIQGRTYKIVEINSKWGRIESVGKVWCHLDYVTKIAGNNTQEVIKFVKTTCTMLRIRRSPSTSGEILGFMAPKKAYGIVQIEGDWGKLSGESEQWVNLNYTVGIP